MTNDHPHDTEHEDMMDDEFVSVAHCHALAAEHFQEAAREHLLAADAYVSGDLDESHRHGYLAYRHQLLGTQYAEMAALEEEDDDFDTEDEQAQQA